MFAPVGGLDFVGICRQMLDFWDADRMFERLQEQNRGGPRYSFIDGPITANNPMGVHHAWGRTYKDLFQRYKAMCGFDQRYQNGFDCQGLWVEVEVEKALGFNSKWDIEHYGLDRFSQECRARVMKYAGIQTQQSKLLGQWMNWSESYYTMSDNNNEYNWQFLKRCHERGWLYRGHRSMPWCPRCGTSISQHEMLEAYAEVAHRAVTVEFPLIGREGALLVWTTTPWTLLANVAAAVHPDLEYDQVHVDGRTLYVANTVRAKWIKKGEVQRTIKGADLVGLTYHGPFEALPEQSGVQHFVVAWKDVSADEGTGIVHIAPGCGQEDFELGRLHGLRVIAPVDELGRYVEGFGDYTGRTILDATPDIIHHLKSSGRLFRQETYRHRYPHCWRCQHELIFRIVDEWFLKADEIRPRMRVANANVKWTPVYVGRRMDDWLTNMADWCISRKRFWGLPLPIYPCKTCSTVTVVELRSELRSLAVDPTTVDRLPELHRPWIDEVVVRCPSCSAEVARTPEVGDCWLDAGIVPFSTLRYLEDRTYWEQWFPAEFVVEMTAQVRGWFYSMLFMAVALEDRTPYLNVLSYEKVLGEDGREMHKSWGNAIWFDDAVESMGPDVIRWLFLQQPVTDPIKFGYNAGKGVKRQFLTLWNVYRLFVMYANLDAPPLAADAAAPDVPLGLEAWVLARLQSTVRTVRQALEEHQVRRAVVSLEQFWDDLSNWYVRRRRREFWKAELNPDKIIAYRTLHHVLVRLTQMLAPFVPFFADHMFKGLTEFGDVRGPVSVHLTQYPHVNPALEAPDLEAGVAFVRRVLSAALAARNAAKLKIRQPLPRLLVLAPQANVEWINRFEADLKDELNVDGVELVETLAAQVSYRARVEAKTLPDHPEVSIRELREAVAQLPGSWVRDRIADGALPVTLSTGQLILTGAEVKVDVEGIGPYAAAIDREIVVALDLLLTPELLRRGAVRQLTHLVQLLRKKANLNVNDRIYLTIDASGPDVALIEEFRDFIGQEILALDIMVSPCPARWASAIIDIDGRSLTIALTRADTASGHHPERDRTLTSATEDGSTIMPPSRI